LGTWILWGLFAIVIPLILAFDLGVLHRKAHTVSLREATLWSAAWVTLALLFAAGVFYFRGAARGLEFLTGYIIELSLSVDNVFLFAVIFTHFQVPPKYQHRVLSWGVMGAILMRALMIVSGAALIHRFEWIIHVFGAFVILTGVKMFLQRDKEPDVENSGLLRWLRRHIPLTNEYDGQNFFTRSDGRVLATPLFFVLVLVEITDLLFALDSIPAIFAVTKNPFIVFTSNIFAILGLRSLYFLLAGVMQLFHYLAVGLSAILIFVGLKMVGLVDIPIGYSLLVIAAILAASIGASLLKARRERRFALPEKAEEEGSGR